MWPVIVRRWKDRPRMARILHSCREYRGGVSRIFGIGLVLGSVTFLRRILIRKENGVNGSLVFLSLVASFFLNIIFYSLILSLSLSIYIYI